LDKVLSAMPKIANPNVLAGYDTADDAGVYRLSDELALVQTIDFFTPIVDDPFTFGAIAAANALSDIYAMGGSPISALSVVAFPGDGDSEILEAIMHGGVEKMREAGCALLGGHSVSDAEIKFGYAVTGTIRPDRIMLNTGARPGDALVLTKAIGTGAIATAQKRGFAQPESLAAAIASMLTLNRAACEAMLGFETHACTDITGFGLLGHAREMAIGSGVAIEVDAASVPLLPGALEAMSRGAASRGLNQNREFVSCAVQVSNSIDPALLDLLYDPQTSGGLLIALPETAADSLTASLQGAHRVGRVVRKTVGDHDARDNKAIRVLGAH
jgi:selenide, water dikinase